MKGPAPPVPRAATVGAMLAAAAAGGGGGLSFSDLGEREARMPWAEADERARSCAARLRALGVAPGDRVAIVLPTSPAFATTFFGVALAGAVPVPLYPPLRLGALGEYNEATARLLASVDAALLVTEPRIAAVLGVAIGRARPRLGWRSPGSLPVPATGPLPDVGPEDLGLIQFSSGSTREPKPVALTHGALAAQCAALEAILPPPPPEGRRGVSWLPLYHDMGLIGALLEATYVAGTLALIPPEHFLVRPSLWPRALARHRAQVTLAPPFALGLCARRVSAAEMAGVDLSSLRVVICGAEPIAPEAVRVFVERFAGHGLDRHAIRPAYGLSEAALAVTIRPPGEPLRIARVDGTRLAARGEVTPGTRPIVSVGAPLPGVEVEVRGPGGEPVGEDRAGHVWVRGPSLMSGYFRRPRETAETLVDGWLDTGDLGFVSGGELHVSGRAKDVVIVRGASRDAQEFEGCLAGLAGMRPGGAAAVGYVAAGAEGEALLVFAERDPLAPPAGDADLERRAREAVLRGTGIEPARVVVVESGALPRTSSGKLRRAETLRRWQAGTLAPPPPASAVRLAGALARSAAGFLRASGRGTPAAPGTGAG